MKLGKELEEVMNLGEDNNSWFWHKLYGIWPSAEIESELFEMCDQISNEIEDEL